MVARPHCVLGVSLGTQKVGIAVIKHNKLLVEKVAKFDYRWSEKKLFDIIRAIDKTRWGNDVTALSIKVPPASHHTQGLKALISEVIRYYKTKDIDFHICTIKELKAHGINESRKNKKQLVQDMAERYPDLLPKAHKELTSHIAYYIKMFEAVAAAELFLEQLQKNK